MRKYEERAVNRFRVVQRGNVIREVRENKQDGKSKGRQGGSCRTPPKKRGEVKILKGGTKWKKNLEKEKQSTPFNG